jgi:copper homeostasis protein
MILEVPCGNIESVKSAVESRADRIELCSALSLGGLTPTIGMLKAIAEYAIDKFVMIRPREGDFIFSKEEFQSMLKDIAFFRSAGANGIVSGILLKNGEIDVGRCRELIDAARPLPFTFHRAFDLTPDAFRSLDALMELKADRLLTSGQAADAFSGRELISKLVLRSENKIKIIAGAGITPDNVSAIYEYTGVKEIHLSGRIKKKNEENDCHPTVSMGTPRSDENGYDVTDASIIRKVRAILDNNFAR